MSLLRVTFSREPVETRMELPASKSISNRYLILQALSNNKPILSNISEADDTRLMQQALVTKNGVIDVHNAGTCMRFLTAYFATTPSKVVLTGNSRMLKRPIRELVDALRTLGAEIDYLETAGFPPLSITGKSLSGGKLTLDTTRSSQFVSALLLVAPTMHNGLELTLTGAPSSHAYIDLTIHCLKQAGVRVNKTDQTLRIEPGAIQLPDVTVTADWSSASYAYLITALNENSRMYLPGLRLDDGQPDAICSRLFAEFGVITEETDSGVLLSHSGQKQHSGVVHLDMQQAPDLVPALVVLCAAIQQEAVLTGISHLQYKESDRLMALTTELNRCGYRVSHDGNSMYIQPGRQQLHSIPVIQTYGDHRMAMALSPLARVLGPIEISEPDVVYKSFPGFWNGIQQAGYSLQFV